MRVVSESDVRLAIDHRPWFSLVLFGALLAGVAVPLASNWNTVPMVPKALLLVLAAFLGYFLLFALAFVVVVFDRVAGTITVRRRSLLRSHHAVYPLAQFREAVVRGSASDTDLTYRLVFRFGPVRTDEQPGDEVAVTSYFTGANIWSEFARAINAWMAHSQGLEHPSE